MDITESLARLRHAAVEGLDRARSLSRDTEELGSEVTHLNATLEAQALRLRHELGDLTTGLGVAGASARERLIACEAANGRLHALQVATREAFTGLAHRLEQAEATLASSRGRVERDIDDATRALESDVARHREALEQARTAVARSRDALDKRLSQARTALATLAQTISEATAHESVCVRDVTQHLEGARLTLRQSLTQLAEGASADQLRFMKTLRDDICAESLGARSQAMSERLEASLRARVETPARLLIETFIAQGVHAVADVAEASHQQTLPTRTRLTEQTIALRDGPNLRRHLRIAAEHLQQLGALDPAGFLARLL